MANELTHRHDDSDPLGPDDRWAHLEPMIAYMLFTGGVLTLAVWQTWAWAYMVGLALTLGWVLGFVLVRDRPERWYRW